MGRSNFLASSRDVTQKTDEKNGGKVKLFFFCSRKANIWESSCRIPFEKEEEELYCSLYKL